MVDDKEATGLPNSKGVAVAVIAIARFLAASNPTMPGHLAKTLAGAEQAGLASADLDFLRTLVRSLSA